MYNLEATPPLNLFDYGTTKKSSHWQSSNVIACDIVDLLGGELRIIFAAKQPPTYTAKCCATFTIEIIEA